LKDGTMYTATDYWLADNELHYVVNDGDESTILLDQFDLQRTVDENAERGVPFTLKPNPEESSPALSPDNGASPSTPGPDATAAGR